MAIQLIHSYPYFSKNQVLTHRQLNEVVTYLEEQGRLTRVGLTGIGIVCGFNLEYTSVEGDLGKIKISAGVGITSEGYLITCSDCEVGKYRVYPADKLSNYMPFKQNPDSEVYDIELLELLPVDYETEDSEEPEEIFELPSDLEEKYVVLLFVEMFDQDLKSCLSGGCDDMGVNRKINVRKLLLLAEDMDKILQRTGNEDSTLFPARYELKDFSLQRAEFAPPFNRFNNVEAIDKQYAHVLLVNDYHAIVSVFSLLHDAYEAFKPVLSPSFPNNPFSPDASEGIINEWVKTLTQNKHLAGIQYFYDFIKDLILSYREFWEVSFDLLTSCRPNNALFPRHLALGEVNPGCVPSKYRQHFVHSPVINHQKDLLQQTISLFTRSVQMVKAFDLNILKAADKFRLKITPSFEKTSLLSQRSIPYYYLLEKTDLEQYWNFNHSKRCDINVLSYFRNKNSYNDTAIFKTIPNNGDIGKELAIRGELNYHKILNKAKIKDKVNPVTRPLSYDRDRFNFYRIEGVLGKPCNKVLDELSQMVEKHNLPFDFIAVRLNNSVKAVETQLAMDHAGGFHDLHEAYVTHRYQLVGLIKTGISSIELIKKLKDLADKDVKEKPGRSDYFDSAKRGNYRISSEKDYYNIINIAFRSIDENHRAKEAEEAVDNILSDLKEFICKTLPLCITDFIDQFEQTKKSYAAVIDFGAQKLFKYILEKTADLFPEDVKEKRPQLVQDWVEIINLAVCQVFDKLFFNRLFRIYYSYKRREYYYQNPVASGQHLFSEFLEAHPGLEHAAGTPPDGTFVAVYGDDKNEPTVVADFMLPYRCCNKLESVIPVCDDEEAWKNIMVAPYARPTYGITFVNQPVNINFMNIIHDIYDLHNQYCESDNKAFHNIKLGTVEPVDNEAKIDKSKDARQVKITPPKDFTGILNFSYTVKNVSNGLESSGILSVLVVGLVKRLQDFNLSINPESKAIVTNEQFPEYFFTEPDYDHSKILVDNEMDRYIISLKELHTGTYTFKYTATHKNETGKGAGFITIRVTNSFVVTGTVHTVDLKQKETIPLQGVNVELENGDAKTVTAQGGDFELELSSAEGSLKFSKKGYETISTPVQKTMSVVMLPQKNDLNLKDHLDSFSNNDLRKFLKNREISFQTNESKANLIERLMEQIDENPIKEAELKQLDDFSLNRLKNNLLPMDEIDSDRFLEFISKG